MNTRYDPVAEDITIPMNFVERKRLFAVFALGLIITSTALGIPPSDFQRVLSSPAAFHGKRVTLIGIAEITNAEFWLYPDARSAKKGDFRKAIFVERNPGGLLYKELNNQWLKISGIVDAKARLPLGYGPCAISLEHIEQLR